jgi:hypothetical protein
MQQNIFRKQLCEKIKLILNSEDSKLSNNDRELLQSILKDLESDNWKNKIQTVLKSLIKLFWLYKTISQFVDDD